jgi:hypothetical protein
MRVDTRQVTTDDTTRLDEDPAVPHASTTNITLTPTMMKLVSIAVERKVNHSTTFRRNHSCLSYIGSFYHADI